MYIVAFNGPPRSGKDTLAELLANHMDQQGVGIMVVPESLSLPLREIAYAMTGWTGPTDGPNYESFKTTQFQAFNFIDGRHVMIDVSERFLKPVYGIEIMAELLRARNENIGPAVLLVRDSGFQIEVDPLIRWVGPKNLCIVTVNRDGTSFDNDSREWVYHSDPEMQLSVDNNHDLAHLSTEAGRIYGRLVNRMGWKL